MKQDFFLHLHTPPFHFVCVTAGRQAGRRRSPQTPVAEWRAPPRVEEHVCMTSILSLYELYFLLRQDLQDKCPSHLWRNLFEHEPLKAGFEAPLNPDELWH